MVAYAKPLHSRHIESFTYNTQQVQSILKLRVTQRITLKVIKKFSTFVGDSTYMNAPPTHRSPLRSNY
jgi:hypothetical protein